MMRVLVPARLRKAVRTWFDSRYISIADHRQDIRDALWEVQTLRREVVTLQGEVERLRNTRPRAAATPAFDKSKIDDAHRLAQETAKALDGVLQNEVLVWQAIDDLNARLASPPPPEPSPRDHGRAGGTGGTNDTGGERARSEERPCV
ncbi:hypothetical protein [Nonomuraea sp. NPDC048916]|uniref:hypothetical protein n=1 Tax=Nonomuraea sp. NPDC048916 TaxID=3154232 RepID=UPI0033E9A500